MRAYLECSLLESNDRKRKSFFFSSGNFSSIFYCVISFSLIAVAVDDSGDDGGGFCATIAVESKFIRRG